MTMEEIEGPEEPAKKHILCYGDSNTWGFVPGSNSRRFPSHVRWPGVLSKLLRANYRITEEGLCGRTTVWDDPFAPGIERNGLKMIGAVLDSHKPLDLVVIFLGTNDLKTRHGATPTDVAKGVELLAAAAASPAFGPPGPGGAKPPAVLVVCPCAIWENSANFGSVFHGGREKSQNLRSAFRQMTRRAGLPLLYAEDFVTSDTADGIHLSADSHGILGQEVAKWVMEWSDRQNRAVNGG